jgi:hypothetical protein
MISIEITRNLISNKTVQYIANLPANLILDDMLMVHGAPPDSINTYLTSLSDDELWEIFDHLEQQIAFIGHTHDPLCCFWDGNIVDFKIVRQGINRLDPKGKTSLMWAVLDSRGMEILMQNTSFSMMPSIRLICGM